MEDNKGRTTVSTSTNTSNQFTYTSMSLDDNQPNKVADDKIKPQHFTTEKDKGGNTFDVIKIAVIRDADCSCCPSCCHKIPLDWSKEIKELLKLAWPSMITFFLTLMLSMVSIIFCGHLGDYELGGVAIGQSIVSVVGVCVGNGMATACDTLFSQTFGSKNKKRVGLVLQQSFIIMGLLILPVWGVLVNTGFFLHTFGIEPRITRLAGIFVNNLLPGLPAVYIYIVLSKFLQCQSIVLPIVVVAAIANVINIPLHYILIFSANLGVRGAAIAQVLSHWVLAIILAVYIWKRRLHASTWPGWSLKCLYDWSSFTRLGAAGIFLVCLEMWALEFGVILSGAVGEYALATQGIVYQLALITFVFPYGMSLAANVRVGNALGALERDRAKTITKVSLICTWIGAVIIAVLYLAIKTVVGWAFTDDQDVVDMVSSVLPLVALFQFFDSTAACCAGVMRGCGLQRLGAFLDAIGYYFVGFPVGITLMFVVMMGIHGLWWGYTIAAIVQGIIFLIAIYRINWDRQEHKAQIRAGMRKKTKARIVTFTETKTVQSSSPINITYNPVNNEINNEPVDEDEMDLLKDPEDSTSPQAGNTQEFKLSIEIILRRIAVLILVLALFIIGIVGSQVLTVSYDELIVMTTFTPNVTSTKMVYP
ncbi:multidrug and toxin extrusion protein 2-like [Saccoglossus kowalevskii]|uniref:Multidrug and toxin extrusion protein n=1 Tax=Saccoglossus kowalevskii TaxID=10224 RepID=A0ABM0GTJ3_SACKO|nr:PREDICTED: multidrug and toxin extrusion protein 2-like [Saccoglossus kowalevskii]